MCKKFIKDSLYGFIDLGEPFTSIVDTEPFQRLRHIKQLGLSYLVYPSANHTRFEHCLGAYYLAEKFARKFDFSNKEEFKIAALLHDVGHAPFSHASEKVVEFGTHLSHEEYVGKIIEGSEIKDILIKAGLNKDKVLDFIFYKDPVGQLISGEIDVDRLDYLARDAYHTGVAYGVIDADLVVKVLKFSNGQFSSNIEYTPVLESILIARYMMFPTIYNHHTVRIAKTMFQDSLFELVSKGLIHAKDLVYMTDADLTVKMKSFTESKETIRRLTDRKLYKLALVLHKDDFIDLNKIFKLRDDLTYLNDIQNALKRDLNVQSGKVLIDVPEKPVFGRSKIIITENGKLLEEFSPLVNSLQQAEWNHWYVGIYCEKDEREKVGAAKESIKRDLNGL